MTTEKHFDGEKALAEFEASTADRDPAKLARECGLFMLGAKRLYDGDRLRGCKGDMWFFELYHHLDKCRAALAAAEQVREPEAIKALKAISYHYENQDMNHVDFRVFAKQTADEAIAAAEQVSGVVVGELPSVNWRKGRRVYYCPECGTEQTEPETVSTPDVKGPCWGSLTQKDIDDMKRWREALATIPTPMRQGDK